jgi:hypothetical protein
MPKIPNNSDDLTTLLNLNFPLAILPSIFHDHYFNHISGGVIKSVKSPTKSSSCPSSPIAFIQCCPAFACVRTYGPFPMLRLSLWQKYKHSPQCLLDTQEFFGFNF